VLISMRMQCGCEGDNWRGRGWGGGEQYSHCACVEQARGCFFEVVDDGQAGGNVACDYCYTNHQKDDVQRLQKHTADTAEAFGESSHHDVDISRVHVAMLADAAAGSSCSVVMLCVYNTNKSMKKHTYICKRIK
jgi:hypothetical protein